MQARILTHERSGLVQNCWEKKAQSHLKNLKPRVDHHFPIFCHHEPWPNWPFWCIAHFWTNPSARCGGSSCRAREDQWPCGRQLGAGSPGSRRNQRCAKLASCFWCVLLTLGLRVIPLQRGNDLRVINPTIQWDILNDLTLIPFFPRASERRVLPIVGVCKTSSHLHISSSHPLIFTSHLHILSSSHLIIFTSSHLHILSSSHLFIFTSSHLHILSSSHLLIFTSSHLHILSSSHLLIFTPSHLHICSSSHLPIFTSHLHICSSSHLLIFTPSHLHICSSSHLPIFTSSHLHICSSSHLLIFTSAHLHICSSSHLPIFTSSYLHICSSSHLLIFTSAHLHICSSSHLLIFTPAHLLSHAFFLSFSLKAEGGAGGESRNVNPFARNEGRSAKTEVKLRFDLSWSNPFARNEGRSAKTDVKLRFYVC